MRCVEKQSPGFRIQSSAANPEQNQDSLLLSGGTSHLPGQRGSSPLLRFSFRQRTPANTQTAREFYHLFPTQRNLQPCQGWGSHRDRALRCCRNSKCKETLLLQREAQIPSVRLFPLSCSFSFEKDLDKQGPERNCPALAAPTHCCVFKGSRTPE